MERELPDQVQEKAERNAELEKTCKARIAILENAVPKVLKELSALRSREDGTKAVGGESALKAWREALMVQNAHLDSLCKELAALEGILERRSMRCWRWVGFFVSLLGPLGIGAAIQWWVFERR